MAPSFDCPVSSLLCAEDNNSIFDDIECGATERGFGSFRNHRNHRTHYQEQSFNALFPVQSDECLASIVESECQHLPAADYLSRLKNGVLDLGARMEVVDWIGKVHAHFGFGPLCAYLSINYLDRFLSVYELPKGKAWMMQLLAVACLSLSAKMEETEVPLLLNLQVAESKFVFEARTIQRMELLVLSTLKWRMQSITPFSFIDYFLHKINEDQTLPRFAFSQSIQLILGTAKGIDFLEFRPSEIAAAVAISVAGETPLLDIETATCVLAQHVEKERMLKCVEMIQESSLMSGSVKRSSGAVQCVPQSPIGVLDAACLSYKSDDVAVGSCANSVHNSPVSKRRKLSTPNETEL